MKRRGYRHPAHTTEPVALDVPATSPVAPSPPTFTTVEELSTWLDGELQNLEIRFHDFVTRQSTRTAAGLSNKESRR